MFLNTCRIRDTLVALQSPSIYYHKIVVLLFQIRYKNSVSCPAFRISAEIKNTNFSKHIQLTSFVLKPHFMNSQSSKNCFLPLICSVCMSLHHIFKAFTQSDMDSQWQVWKSFNIQKENNCPAQTDFPHVLPYNSIISHVGLPSAYSQNVTRLTG